MRVWDSGFVCGLGTVPKGPGVWVTLDSGCLEGMCVWFHLCQGHIVSWCQDGRWKRSIVALWHGCCISCRVEELWS